MKIAFHGANASNFRDGIEPLIGLRHEIVDLSDALDKPGERDHFQSAEVVIGIRLSADDPLPLAARLYQAPAAGTDAIDAGRLPAGAVLCNAFGHEAAIAEYVMAALLLRHAPVAQADARLRQGHWDFWPGRSGALRKELGSQTIGLMGFGHIGKAVAARARAFGMKVTVANRSPVPPSPLVDQSFGLGDLAGFMGSADVIVVSLPLTESTRGIVGSAELAAMRPHGVIANVGRGPVIDERALYDALAGDRIGGAVIDTWYRYPAAGMPETTPSELPFETLSNLVMTPHMSGWTEGTVLRRKHAIADNIRRLAEGAPLLNVVSKVG